MSTKAWIIFVVVCVVGFGGLIFLSQKEKVNVTDNADKKVQTARDESGGIADHVSGNPDAKVILVEYGDFQCPACGDIHPLVKNVTKKHQGEVAFIFRSFPLPQLHPNARAASAAAEAAGLVGKYWQMHDLIFENQQEWEAAKADERTDIFAGYAEKIGIKKDEFISTLENKNEQINQKINYDQAVGKKAKVSGTPSFFLNGRQLDQSEIASEESLNKAIEAELKKQSTKPQPKADTKTEAKQPAANKE